MSEAADDTRETINVRFESRAFPVADFEDASAYTDHKNDPIMWTWEFTRRTHWYQFISDLILVADSCEEGDSIPADLRQLYGPVLEAHHVQPDSDESERIMGNPPLVSTLASLFLKGLVPVGFDTTNWRKAGYWQHPEGPPDDLHTPHVRSHQTARGPWAIDWPGMREALASDPHVDVPSILPPYWYPVVRKETVGGMDSFKSQEDYERLRNDDSTLGRRVAQFAFDLSLPIEWQLNAVRNQLAFMQRRAVQSGDVEQVARAESLPGANGTLMLRCLDADADRRNPNNSQIMRAFGWDPASDRTRFKRLRSRAIAFRDELAPKLCELRT